ncbi:Octicosapeptide/Phox/Bem1p family protein isoform 1 [Dorcoceras hygrometricum]|uniref:Octicosapeptide/Phox/Bem1p family protein isoform 1 n=1 Tax=Dorcoceras hygrometricum TaxID=472368 RepID=A0A2Z7ATM2_9LAMI|nr:Octicosapeptide/Phox/Bem1p family protein isoform 1 [Dorcoceras hygrometricum]
MVVNDLSLKPIKFLCSYGGRILPRYPDGKLRYHGGETRVLSVERSVSFSDLLLKLAEMCGTPVSLRCQLPAEDLDSLVSITSDEDLANLIEEYDRASLKIRAFLSAPKIPAKKVSPPPSTASSPKSPFCCPAITGGGFPPRCRSSGNGRSIRHASRPPQSPPSYAVKAAGKSPHHQYACHHRYHANGGRVYLIQSGNNWQ